MSDHVIFLKWYHFRLYYSFNSNGQ